MLESPGALLRAWRRHERLTQSDVAALLHVTPSTVSTWETGARRIPRDALRRLDDGYGAGGCLVDLVRAIGSPQAYLATVDGRQVTQTRRHWPHVFTAGAGPVWVWVRSPHGGEPAGWAYSGPNGSRFGRPTAGGRTGMDGLFLTIARWKEEWPLHVVLDEPGWVDFGRGVPPAWLKGAARIARSTADTVLVDPADRLAAYVLARTRERDRGDPATFAARLRALLGAEFWDRHEAAWRRGGPAPETVQAAARPGGPRPPATAEARRAVHRRLREARGLSRAGVAVAASALLGAQVRGVSDDQILNYESGHGSRVPYFPAVLDAIYDAGGWTCCEPVRVDRAAPGRFAAELPDFWVGPVTVSVGPSRTVPSEGVVALETDWRRNELPLGPWAQSFTYCRTARDGPLRVAVPAGRTVRVQLGHDPDATDADRHWLPTDRHADAVVEDTLEGLMALIGKTVADLDRALERSGPSGEGPTV